MDDLQETNVVNSKWANSPVNYSGNHKEMFGIWIKNLLLSIVTVGVYSFWGRVLMTRYIYQRTSVSGGEFDYHATGKQKFFGFLKGMGILLVALALFYVVRELLISSIGPELGGLITLLMFYVGIVIVQPLIMVASLRFKCAYSSWNNVRFKFHGTVKECYIMYLKAIPFIIITFGMYTPFLIGRIQKFRYNNATLGTQKIECRLDTTEYGWMLFFGQIVTGITFGIYSFWLTASIIEMEVESIYIQDNNFKTSITGGDIFKTTLKGLLIIVGTLGIGIPVFYNMQLSLFLNSLTYKGVLDVSDITNDEDGDANALADGVTEAGETLELLGDVFG